MEVEGRRYLLSQMDKPRQHPAGPGALREERVRRREAVFHIAMPTDSPSRELVEKFFFAQADGGRPRAAPAAAPPNALTASQPPNGFEAAPGATL